MSETATTTRSDEAFPARGDLHRAYAGILSVRCLVRATAAAASHAQIHQRRLDRHDNPIGYLFRVGRTSLDTEVEPDDGSWRTAEPGAVSEALLHDAVLSSLRALPRRHQEVVWLVRACRWTNVQAGEALALAAADVADAVSGGGRALCRSLGVSDTELGRRLRALADARVARLPELVRTAEEADAADAEEAAEPNPPLSTSTGSTSTGSTATLSTSTPSTSTLFTSARSTSTLSTSGPAEPTPPGRWSRLSDPRVLAAAIVAVLVLGGGSLLAAALSSPDTVPPGPETVTPAPAMHDRPLVEEPALARSGSARSVAGTFALAAVGDPSAIRAADAARAARPITLTGGDETSVLEQLAAMAAVGGTELTVEDGDGWRIRYQTGTGEVDGTAVAWTTGVVEIGAERFVFAHNADLELADGAAVELPVPARLAAVIDFLRLGGVIPTS